MPKVKPRITEDEHCRLGGVEGEALQVVLGDHGCRWHVLAAWRNAAQLDEVDDPLEVDQRRCLLDGGATACGPSQRWLALAFKAPDLALRPARPVWLPLRWLPLPAPASASAAPASLLQMQASARRTSGNNGSNGAPPPRSSLAPRAPVLPPTPEACVEHASQPVVV